MAHMKLKHYRAIAEILRQHRLKNPVLVLEIASKLADYFERDNPESFRRDRFFEACGFLPAKEMPRAQT